MSTKVLGTILGFFTKERGQDLSEYCLITALIALIALGIFWHVSGGIDGMWAQVNSTLAAGSATAGPGAGHTSQPTPGDTADR